jgi:hypothetical protein
MLSTLSMWYVLHTKEANEECADLLRFSTSIAATCTLRALYTHACIHACSTTLRCKAWYGILGLGSIRSTNRLLFDLATVATLFFPSMSDKMQVSLDQEACFQQSANHPYCLPPRIEDQLEVDRTITQPPLISIV